MGEPYSIRVLVLEGDPEGAKIVELMNWTGVGIAFPRSAWDRLRGREQFGTSGVYILSGPTEGTDDELPTVYVGQGDVIRVRIDDHIEKKEFWDWGYAFVSGKGCALNRAHSTWLEHALLLKAKQAGRCHLDNGTQPNEPKLSESDLVDTRGFLRELLRILPLLGVRVFEQPKPVALPGSLALPPAFPSPAKFTLESSDVRDTVVVPANEPGFTEVFLGTNSWDAIRIGGGMLNRIKYIAAYQTAPIKAVTHYAPVDRIEPYGDDGKYRLVFAGAAKPLPQPIPWADAPQGLLHARCYTSLSLLLSAKKVTDLFPPAKEQSETY